MDMLIVVLTQWRRWMLSRQAGAVRQAVQAMTGHGGWPMTVFLTPEGEPFYGGTYFPPEPRQGMPRPTYS